MSHQREWQIANPIKYQAQRLVYRAIETGALVRPATCARCPAPKPHAHHEDYSKPLDVVWLCSKCHAARHAEMRASDPDVIAHRAVLKQRRDERANARRLSEGRCESCGGGCLKGSRTCRACRTSATHSRRVRIATMYAEGATTAELAVALGCAHGAVSVALAKMRRDGWDLPYRRVGWTKRAAAAAEQAA